MLGKRGTPENNLVAATKRDMGFPTIPGVPSTAPTGLINPVLQYDWGRDFDYSDAAGVQTVMPPKIKKVIRMMVPRVDEDGNELGGVPVVLRARRSARISAGTARPAASTKARSATTPAA